MPHHAAEQDSGSRCSPPHGLGCDLPVLRSDLTGLKAPLPGLNAPLSSQHVPPLRGHDGLLSQGQGGRRLVFTISGHKAGVQPDAVAPHSATAVHYSGPQDRSSFGPKRCA